MSTKTAFDKRLNDDDRMEMEACAVRLAGVLQEHGDIEDTLACARKLTRLAIQCAAVGAGARSGTVDEEDIGAAINGAKGSASECLTGRTVGAHIDAGEAWGHWRLCLAFADGYVGESGRGAWFLVEAPDAVVEKLIGDTSWIIELASVNFALLYGHIQLFENTNDTGFGEDDEDW